MSVRRMMLRPPLLGPRTRLYHLEPRGLGTPQVESLTGYVMRLAEAHRVTTSRLVTAEVWPLLQAQGDGAVPGGPWALDAAPRYSNIMAAPRRRASACIACANASMRSAER